MTAAHSSMEPGSAERALVRDLVAMLGWADPPGERAVHFADSGDCCALPARYRVVLPPAAGRVGDGELLLCARHARSCGLELARAYARVYDVRGGAVGCPSPLRW